MRTIRGFWKHILPDLAVRFELGKEVTQATRVADLERGLKKVIKKMDDDEFNVFLAQVVIRASAKQIMGVDLTKQIESLQGLRE